MTLRTTKTVFLEGKGQKCLPSSVLPPPIDLVGRTATPPFAAEARIKSAAFPDHSAPPP